MIAAELGVHPPRLHLPVWPFWMAGLLCEAVCVPLRIEPPLYRRRVDFYTKSRAFDTTRARTELGFDPTCRSGQKGIRRTARMVLGEQGSVCDMQRLNIVHICDHLGWEGSRMHGVKRLFAWMIPRFDATRFNVSLVSLRRKDLSEDTLEQFGVDVTYLGGTSSIRGLSGASCRSCERKRADVVHMHGYGATTFGRLCAWRLGFPRFCTSTRTTPTRRGFRRSPIGCWRRTPTWRSRSRSRRPSSRSARG